MEQKNKPARQTVVQAPETYRTPAMETIEVEVEKGFAQSVVDSEDAPSGYREG
ncbi:hypothetical protein FACS189440_03850 [Bacteroidia bacterium]|nr:hypothetical protein FACS189440_03850 [Bacteroidia bacterium]